MTPIIAVFSTLSVVILIISAVHGFSDRIE